MCEHIFYFLTRVPDLSQRWRKVRHTSLCPFLFDFTHVKGLLFCTSYKALSEITAIQYSL